MITVRVILDIVAVNSWSIKQMVINNALLQGDIIKEDMQIPQEFEGKWTTVGTKNKKVNPLLKLLYELKQASRQFNIKLAHVLPTELLQLNLRPHL